MGRSYGEHESKKSFMITECKFCIKIIDCLISFFPFGEVVLCSLKMATPRREKKNEMHS